MSINGDASLQVHERMQRARAVFSHLAQVTRSTLNKMDVAESGSGGYVGMERQTGVPVSTLKRMFGRGKDGTVKTDNLSVSIGPWLLAYESADFWTEGIVPAIEGVVAGYCDTWGNRFYSLPAPYLNDDTIPSTQETAVIGLERLTHALRWFMRWGLANEVTQLQLAEMIGVSERTVSKLFTYGDITRPGPSFKHLVHILGVLDLDPYVHQSGVERLSVVSKALPALTPEQEQAMDDEQKLPPAISGPSMPLSGPRPT